VFPTLGRWWQAPAFYFETKWSLHIENGLYEREHDAYLTNVGKLLLCTSYTPKWGVLEIFELLLISTARVVMRGLLAI
jgi:hypothetical protein